MAVKPIDRFVSALHRENADELVLETGKTGRLRCAGQERVLLAQEVRSEQIEVLLRDIVPEEMQVRFQNEGELVFPYRAPTGPVAVRIRRVGGRLGVSIRPYPSRQVPRVASPEPAPAPAPVLVGSIASPVSKQVIDKAEGDPISLDLGSASIPRTSSTDLKSSDSSDAMGGLSVGSLKVFRDSTSRNRIDPILCALVEVHGSDVYLTTGLVPRARKDGEMIILPGFEVTTGDMAEAWLMEIASPKMQLQFERLDYADYAYEIIGLARFRVHAFREHRGFSAVIRLIPTEPLTLDRLEFPPALRDLAELDRGMVLVAGPLGSGRSTTLAALIDHINRTKSSYIVTFEDPIEVLHKSYKSLVHQREVYNQGARAFRAIRREDPDVILLGSMDGLEAATCALDLAESNHLILGSMTAHTAVSSIERLVDLFPTNRQTQVRNTLAHTLRGVVCQTLCKKTAGGRVAALEILLVVPAVMNLIREGKTFQIPSIIQASRNLGMQASNDALAALVAQNIIAGDEALRRSVARAELRQILERG